MPGNLDSNADQSLMRIADQLATMNKILETQNALLRKVAEKLDSK